MTDRRLFVLQRSLSLGVVVAAAAAIGFVAGFSLRSVNEKTFNLPSLLVRQQQSDLHASQVKVLIAQQDKAYKKVIARLVQQENVRRLNIALPTQVQGKTIRAVKLKDKEKVIALTFDDGPWVNTTSQVLKVLKNNNVKATFFVVGRQVEKYPKLVKEVVANGHALGNHTWSHQYHQYNASTAADELERTAALLYKITGVNTSIFRPPGGILNNGLTAYAHHKKYAVVMWSVDSRDWRSRPTTTQAFIKNLVKDAKPGSIVLLHDGGGDRSNTVQALPQLIAELKKRGYKFVTVPELLRMG